MRVIWILHSCCLE